MLSKFQIAILLLLIVNLVITLYTGRLTENYNKKPIPTTPRSKNATSSLSAARATPPAVTA
jgi:hypothetical protein